MTPNRATGGNFTAWAVITIAVLGVLAVTNGRTAQPAVTAPLVWQACRLEHPYQITAYQAECTRIRVPENRQLPARRTIELFVARVSAIGRRKASDPLFLLAGGPGMDASSMYASTAAVFARIGRERDIVVVDQRGTGRSHPLICAPEPKEPIGLTTLQNAIAAARSCRDTLAKDADLTQYTTSSAVQDLDAVRAALGYDTINLYGSSYGTRVAQHYTRLFPQHVRSVILDGVVSPDTVLGPEMALDAEAALERIFTRCAADASCRKAFGDPHVHYRAVRARVAAAAVDVTLSDPRTSKPRTFLFGHDELASVLRLQSYNAQQAALLPLALYQAAVEDNFVPLAAQALMTEDALDNALASGMHNSVVCAEDVPFIDPAKVNSAGIAATYIGTVPLDGLRAVCADWPHGAVDSNLRTLLSSGIPMLLLSGSDDPVTPPQYASRAATHLTNSRHIVVPGMGHGQLALPCMDRVMAAFVRDAAPRTLDTSCLQAVRPAPFFISAAGPAP